MAAFTHDLSLSVLRLGAAVSFHVLSHLPVECHHHGDDPAEANLLHGRHEQDAGVPGHPR